MSTAARPQPQQQPRKRLSLSDTIKGSRNLPPRIVIYGRPAVGKTSVAVEAKDPYVIMSPGETGLHTLMDAGSVPQDIPNIEVGTWLDYVGLLDDLRTKEHQRKTLVVDVLNGMEKLANHHICATQYGGDMTDRGFMSFQAGYRTVAAGVWKEHLIALDRLRERGMMIVLLAHTSVGNHKNPQGNDYNRWFPAFDGKPTWEQTFAWADMVLFADYEVATSKEKGESKAKATGGNQRVLRTVWDAAYDAKNRFNLPQEIEMGESGKEAWSNLMAAMEAAKKPKE